MTRFVHLTDLHISHPQAGDKWLRADTPSQVALAVAQINRLDPAPDFVVASGDLTNLGDALSYGLLKDLLAPLKMPVLLGLGNHDKREAFHSTFATGRGDAPHDHEAVIAGVHVITLDSLMPGATAGTLLPAQLAWLREALARHPQVPKVISIHHGPRITGRELNWETLDAQSAAELASALQGANVLGILTGHIHINAMRMWHGVPVFVSQGLNTTIDLAEPEDMHILEGTGLTIFDLYPAGLSASFLPLTPKAQHLGVIPAERLKTF